MTVGCGVLLQLVSLAIVESHRSARPSPLQTLSYKQTGRFPTRRRQASAPASYRTGRLTTGDPVFLRLVDPSTSVSPLPVNARPATQTGSKARVPWTLGSRTSNGWKETIRAGPAAIAGDSPDPRRHAQTSADAGPCFNAWRGGKSRREQRSEAERSIARVRNRPGTFPQDGASGKPRPVQARMDAGPRSTWDRRCSAEASSPMSAIPAVGA